jgi:hypothetical protein
VAQGVDPEFKSQDHKINKLINKNKNGSIRIKEESKGTMRA